MNIRNIFLSYPRRNDCNEKIEANLKQKNIQLRKHLSLFFLLKKAYEKFFFQRNDIKYVSSKLKKNFFKKSFCCTHN